MAITGRQGHSRPRSGFRKSGKGHDLDLTTFGSMVVWLAADDILVQQDGSVASWPDRTGNGNTFTQATGGQQPILRKNTFNGHNSVEFGVSSTTNLDSNSLSPAPTQPNTFYMVTNCVSSATEYWFDSVSGTRQAFFGVTGSNCQIFASNQTWSLAQATPTGQVLFVCQYNGASSTMRTNTGLHGSGDSGASNCANIRLGAGGNTSIEYFRGHMSEFLFYNGLHTTNQINLIAQSLCSKYGLLWTSA